LGLRQKAPYYAYRGASGVARALPRPVASAAARGAGVVLRSLMSERRTMLERHLRRAHGPHLDGRALDREVRHAFSSYARYWMEAFRLPGTPASELDAGMTWEGIEHMDAAMAAGRGAIVGLPHLGGWEFGGAWFASLGYRPTVVAERIEPPELYDWFVDLRKALGLTVVALGPEAGPALLRALKANEVVGLVCDRDIPGSGVEVEFFGEKTTLPSGPATLALRTGAPILPAAIYFQGRRGHHGVVRPPVPVERTGKLRDDATRITQLLAHELEALIRVAPDQWHLLQPNWPSDTAAEAAG
jgi:KDO2-lipid IV(A) lauroyltransferase